MSPMPPPWPAGAGVLGSGISETTDAVVSMRPAIEAALPSYSSAYFLIINGRCFIDRPFPTAVQFAHFTGLTVGIFRIRRACPAHHH